MITVIIVKRMIIFFIAIYLNIGTLIGMGTSIGIGLIYLNIGLIRFSNGFVLGI